MTTLAHTASITIRGEELLLLPQKAIYWKRKKWLLLADLHFGKTGHFRKAGIAIPQAVFTKDLTTLQVLLNELEINRCLFLGDLFHSTYNREWELMGKLLQQCADIEFGLVKGNHDILDEVHYRAFNILPLGVQLIETPFLFLHEPIEQYHRPLYAFAGHLHPGVRLSGKGRQSLRLPCFYVGERQCILPAFGSFTGFIHLRPKTEDRIFVIADGRIVEM